MGSEKPQVAIVMGSDSDLAIMGEAKKMLVQNLLLHSILSRTNYHLTVFYNFCTIDSPEVTIFPNVGLP